MHRFMVNIKSTHIFNRYFEMQKSTRNSKKNAEIGANRTPVRRVYLRGIYLDAALRETHASLIHPRSAICTVWVDCRLRMREMVQLLDLHVRKSLGAKQQGPLTLLQEA
jgi:hypothetical protein